MTENEHPHLIHSNKNPKGSEGLGLAGNMARAFILSPLTPLLLVASLAIGLLGLLITPRQEDPQISVPMVDIFVRYPGASTEQVATLVADPLQRLMSELTGVKHVYSASMRDGAMVTVEFDVGEDMESSLVKLYDRLQSNMDKIPPDVSQPLVKPKSVDDVPLVTLTLWSSEVDDATLNLIALDLLQRLNEVPNTSQGFVVHGRTEQARVEVYPEVLKGFGVTMGQIAKTIAAANSEKEVGNLEYSDRTFNLYTGAYLKNKQDIDQLVLGIVKGRPVYVRDVAKVSVGPSETKSSVRYYSGAAYPEKRVANGESAVTLAIAKKKGSNGVTVASDILNKVGYLKGRIIPDNVVVSVTRNYGQTAKDKVDELLFKLFVATGAVAILVLFPLGWRAALVVVIVIPVVILITVFSAWTLGYTIDRVSLFALIFSIGILVDDAIVVVENIYRRWLEKGEIDTRTSVEAVGEVGNPTILATFTVIAALLPMGFVSGMMGPYMEPIPALGSVAMLFSLFAAFIFTPWLAFKLKPSLAGLEKAEEKEHRQSEWLGRFFHRLLIPLIEKRVLGWGFLITIIVVFFLCCSLFYTQQVRVKMLPLDNKPEFNVILNMPEGTAFPVTANLTHRMAEDLRTITEVTAVQSYVGTASPFNFNGLVRHYYLRDKPWMADIQVQLLDKTERHRTSHEIAVQAREMLKKLDLGGGRFQVVEMPPGPPVLQSVVAEVYGPSAGIRRQVAEDMTQMFQQAQYIDDVDNYMEADFEMWRFAVNREKALRLGISVDDINKTLDMSMGGYVLGDIKTQSLLEPTFIILQLPLEVRSEFSRLTQLPIMTPEGTTIPLSELGEFHPAIQDKPIYMKDLRPIEYVTGETVGRLASPIYGMLEVEKMLKNYHAPDGVALSGNYINPPEDSYQSGFEWGGEWTVTYETFRDMGIAFGAAIVLIYMLVVWEFGNFTLPAIVVAPIPLTLIGIIPGHWLLNAEFTATSMIGFIALAGIIVRNSILLVDFSKNETARGVHVVDAVINACKTRTRPILITAFALVGGSSVILFDPIFQGMAISLLFGVLVSTLLTLVVIPLGCISGRKAFGEDTGPGESGKRRGRGPGPAPAMAALEDTKSNQPAPRKKIGQTVFSAIYYIVIYIGLLLKDFLIGIFQLVVAMYRLLRRKKSKSSIHASGISAKTPSSGGRSGAQKKPASRRKAAGSRKASAGKTSTIEETASSRGEAIENSEGSLEKQATIPDPNGLSSASSRSSSAELAIQQDSGASLTMMTGSQEPEGDQSLGENGELKETKMKKTRRGIRLKKNIDDV